MKPNRAAKKCSLHSVPERFLIFKWEAWDRSKTPWRMGIFSRKLQRDFTCRKLCCSVNQKILSIHYVPGAGLSARETMANATHDPSSLGLNNGCERPVFHIHQIGKDGESDKAKCWRNRNSHVPSGRVEIGTTTLQSNWVKSSKVEDVQPLATPFLGLYPKPAEAPPVFHRGMYRNVYGSTVCNSRKTETT